MKNKGNEVFRHLPREYFSILEQERTVQISANGSLMLTVFSALVYLFAFFVAYSLNELTIALVFSATGLFIGIIIVLPIIFLYMRKIRSRLPRLFTILELAGLYLLTFSPISLAVSIFTDRGVNTLFIVLLLLLVPVSIAAQIFFVHIQKKAVIAGNYLPGGEGFYAKANYGKYLPYISIITGVLEASRMSIVIWASLSARLWGNITLVLVFPFIVIILVLVFSMLVANTWMHVCCLRIFPDWASPENGR